MKALHSIKTDIDERVLTAAARLLQLYPEMRFRLTGVPYDYENNLNGSPIQYFHVGRWTDWTTESIHGWATGEGLGLARRPIQEADLEAARERFEPR